MSPVRLIFILLCCAILGGGYYLASRGVWGASASVTSIRAGSAGAVVGGRVK